MAYQNTSPDIKLSTGRTITHRRIANGPQIATPTTGPDEMTDAEWIEYCEIILRDASAKTTGV